MYKEKTMIELKWKWLDRLFPLDCRIKLWLNIDSLSGKRLTTQRKEVANLLVNCIQSSSNDYVNIKQPLTGAGTYFTNRADCQ